MIIEKNLAGAALTLTLSGRLDTTTAPQLEAELKASLAGVLLAAQKIMNKQGDMVVRSVNETIAEIFDVTGFCDILTIE